VSQVRRGLITGAVALALTVITGCAPAEGNQTLWSGIAAPSADAVAPSPPPPAVSAACRLVDIARVRAIFGASSVPKKEDKPTGTTGPRSFGCAMQSGTFFLHVAIAFDPKSGTADALMREALDAPNIEAVGGVGEAAGYAQDADVGQLIAVKAGGEEWRSLIVTSTTRNKAKLTTLAKELIAKI
jgi:hypothetical protein